MRINKYIALCGLSSRRKSEELITSGGVAVNGKTVTDLATQIDEEKDTVTVNGQKLSPPQSFVYYMLNKPKGYVCSLKDDRGRKTVMDLIHTDTRVFPVGRLDWDSEGMLILTNDGALTQKLTHPSGETPKTYIVKIEGGILESELAVLRAGVVIAGERFSKCGVKVLEKEKDTTRMEVVLHEGKNREIRRMFEAIGKTITLLKRVQIGGLRLGGLSRGEYRELKPQEVGRLLQGAKKQITNDE